LKDRKDSVRLSVSQKRGGIASKPGLRLDQRQNNDWDEEQRRSSLTATIDLSGITPGFQDPVLESQLAYRALLAAMSSPGTIQHLSLSLTPPPRFDIATAAICLTLFDHDTRLWLEERFPQAVRDWLRFHCRISLVSDIRAADFAVLTPSPQMLRPHDCRTGTEERPHCSATLILQLEYLAFGTGLRLTGPGIRDSHRLEVPEIPAGFWASRHDPTLAFPRGVDIFLTHRSRLTALPRTTNVEGY
jgi:alpha-D-ribose 1-methylphosphonate 5-triphosphate synthase subunit PhnH